MKTKIFIFIFYCLLISECKAQWVQIGPFPNTYISSLAFNGSNIFAGSNGIYRSTDNGSTWMFNNYPPTLWCLATNGNYVFAGNSISSYFSSNNGLTWLSIPNHSAGSGSLLINQGVLFAGEYLGGDGIYKSSDNGQNWSHVLSSTGVFAMAASDSNMFGAARWGAIYHSTNFGNNWSQISTIDSIYNNLSMLIKGQYIFAGSQSGNISDSGAVYVSSNYGINWTKTSLHNTIICSLASDGTNVFAGTGRGVYMTTDDGTTWIPKNDNMPAIRVRAINISGAFIYAGTETQGIWKRALNEIVRLKLENHEVPNSFLLSQNYPNPFNPVTKIKFAIPSTPLSFGEGLGVRLVIYDALGKEVEILVDKKLEKGEYQADFDGTNLPSGVYYYQLTVNSEQLIKYTETKKMVLMK